MKKFIPSFQPLKMSVSDKLGGLIAQASRYVSESEPERAVTILEEHWDEFQNDPVYLESFGETLLENGQLDKAYGVLTKACELDPEALKGVEKFLYLGQISGGPEGKQLLETGVNRLLAQLQSLEGDGQDLGILMDAYGGDKAQVKEYLQDKLNQAIFAIIEIWMTDLCMEESAEQECDSWIDKSMQLDPTNPEAWSLLASIRISQQRAQEASEAIKKAWELFSAKKALLEQSATENATLAAQARTEAEYLALADPLVALARFAIEMGLFEDAAEIAASVQDINDQSIESSYLGGFANYLEAVRRQNNIEDPRTISLDYTKYPIKTKVSKEDSTYETLRDSRRALTEGFKLLQVDDVVEQTDPEVRKAVMELLTKLGGPLLKEKDQSGINEDNWEDQIDS